MRGVPRLRAASSLAASGAIVRAELGGVDRDDPGEVVDVVELEVLVHSEAFAERARRACRCGWWPR